jgi:hypothetical protein
MAVSGGLERDFFILDGKTATSGGSLNVTNGVLAVVSEDSKDLTQNGRKVYSSFSGLSKDKAFSFLLGSPDLPVSLNTTNKAYASQAFKLSDIIDYRVEAPNRSGLVVDDFVLGWNGQQGTEIAIGKATSTFVDITLSGDAMYNLGYENGTITHKIQMHYPYVDENGVCSDCENGVVTMQEIVEKAVKRFSKIKLLGQVPITDYVDIFVVNSLNSAIVGADYKFFNLSLVDKGTKDDLARVQAQYPAFKVVQTIDSDLQSVYTILAPIATVLPAFVSKPLPSKIKGCPVCPAGYAAIPAGFVYSIAMEDDGVDLKANLAILPGFVAASNLKIGSSQAGVGTYTVVVLSQLNEAQIAAFKATNAVDSTAVFDLAGAVKAVCKNPAVVATPWVAGTEIGTAVSKNFTVAIKDDVCNAPNLAALQAAYPNLVITQGVSALCQTTFSTNVLSNIVFPECSIAFRKLFEAEAPSNFELNVWKEAAPVYDVNAKMGIRVKGKPFTLSGDEYTKDDIPFYATSTRLAIAGGQASMIAESWNSQPRPFAVKVFTIAADPESLGGCLWNREDASRLTLDGFNRLKGNNYGKTIWGQESRADGLKQYMTYTMVVKLPNQYSVQDYSAPRVNLNFLVEVGRQEAVENLLNSVAQAAGLPLVQAFAK